MKIKNIFAVAVGIAVLSAMPVRAEETSEIVPRENELEQQQVQQQESQKPQKILDNIYLENVDLSGLTVDEAVQAVDKRVEETTGYRIVLHMDDQ